MSEKMKFSETQELAISASGSNYLISAGAGSGKTAVLTERIYRLAKKDKTLDRFLVVTFTRFAAEEMKHRVRTKLLEDPDTIYLASEVDNAHIETFDSFCLYLAKKYFYVLGISKDLSLVDKSILSIKRNEYLEEIMERNYGNPSERFTKVVLDYCAKNDDPIRNYVINILEKSDTKGDKYAYIESLRNDFFNDDFIDKSINELFNELKEKIRFIRSGAEQLESIEDATNIISHCDYLLEAEDYDTLYSRMEAPFPKKTASKDCQDGDFRNLLKDFYDRKIKVSANKPDNNYGDTKKIKEKYLSTKDLIYLVIDIALEVEHKLDEYKKEKNAYSFGDVSRFVLTLLNNEEIKEEVKNNYDYIMIDEYQDTNDVQDTVMALISKNNIYMVGDVKQSIYRFRGADSHIFQEKYNHFKENDGGKEIDLNYSYRSRKEVVDFINELFSELMIPSVNAIDYSNGHNFGYGNKDYEGQGDPDSYKPEAYLYSVDKDVDKAEYEAKIIASDIKKRMQNGYQVFDKDLKKQRDCTYSDFAIIIDRSKYFDTFRKVFTDLNVPLKVQGKEELFGSDVSLVVKNLMKMLALSLDSNYGKEYHHSFFSVARSFLFMYDDQKLFDINKNNQYLLEPFAQQMELFKERLRFASIKETVKTLYEEYHIYDAISRIGRYYPNIHKLEVIIGFAESLDVLGYTISDFVNYVDKLISDDQDVEFVDKDSQDNSVTLISIHGSKGLEYNIVYYPGLDVNFNRQDINTSYLISPKYGLVCADTIDNSKISAFLHLAKEEGLKADFEEKIRFLYVALTRARQKIIFVSGSSDKVKKGKYPVQSLTMNDILNLTDVLYKYNSSFTIEDIKLEKEKQKANEEKVVLKKISIPSKLIKKQRASKTVDDTSISVLDFGTEVHAYLENMNLDSDDLTYIKSKRMRKIVENVKNSPLFSGITNEMVRHEYPFYDKENNLSGVIDALIIKEDEIDIVDFKLKHIEDEEYNRQLRLYRDYIYKIANGKKIRMFLLAALTGEMKEVI